MAERSMAFAHWNPHWNSVAFGVGATGAIALSATGYGQIALALLAGLGAAGAVLFGAGHLHLKPEGGSDERIHRLFGALPAAVAVTNSRGLIQWSSDAFLNAASLGDDHDLSRLGDRHPEIAAAIFRLLAAGCSGKAHAEAVHLRNFPSGDPVLLKVIPFIEHGKRSSLLVWQIENAKKTIPGERPKLGLDMLPVPALSVGKDLTVQGANKGFEKLAGCEPTGKQAWSLFRTRRGNPLTRARLRDMIARAGSAIPVQIISASGYARAASLHLGADINEGQTWIITPADPAAGSLDEFLRGAPRACADSHGFHKRQGDHPSGKRRIPPSFRRSFGRRVCCRRVWR